MYIPISFASHGDKITGLSRCGADGMAVWGMEACVEVSINAEVLWDAEDVRRIGLRLATEDASRSGVAGEGVLENACLVI